jgi:hypothetical protein
MIRLALLLALWPLLLPSLALARDDGRYANSPHKDWVKGLKDKNGNGCCDDSDGYPADVEWDTDHNHYRVRIDGLWYVVPPDAVLTEPNRLGYPMVWYWRENGVPQIRCFIPGLVRGTIPRSTRKQSGQRFLDIVFAVPVGEAPDTPKADSSS